MALRAQFARNPSAHVRLSMQLLYEGTLTKIGFQLQSTPLSFPSIGDHPFTQVSDRCY